MFAETRDPASAYTPNFHVERLGDGERKAIQLMRAQRASLLVTDNRNAYKTSDTVYSLFPMELSGVD